MKAPEPDRITIPLRLSRDLHARLKALAEKDQRSLNAFIAFALARVAGDLLTPMPAQQSVGPAHPSRIRKVGPNVPCPCGSGTKYKKCHGRPRAS